MPICAHAFCRFEVERDTAVDATVAEVAENGPTIIMFAKQLVEITQVIAQNFRRDSGILP
jgi:hypothetical protein